MLLGAPQPLRTGTCELCEAPFRGDAVEYKGFDGMRKAYHPTCTPVAMFQLALLRRPARETTLRSLCDDGVISPGQEQALRRLLDGFAASEYARAEIAKARRARAARPLTTDEMERAAFTLLALTMPRRRGKSPLARRPRSSPHAPVLRMTSERWLVLWIDNAPHLYRREYVGDANATSTSYRDVYVCCLELDVANRNDPRELERIGRRFGVRPARPRSAAP